MPERFLLGLFLFNVCADHMYVDLQINPKRKTDPSP